MTRNLRTLVASVAFVVLGACATGTFVLKEDNIDAKVAGSPYIKRHAAGPRSSKTEASPIDVYYKVWTALTRPDAVENWRYHFVISEGSIPSRRFEVIADVIHYQTSRNDNGAIQFLKTLTRKEGGDAIANVWRSPAIDAIRLPANIVGYRYHADIIRYDK